MTRFGYFLSSEEYTPDQLVEIAVLAEEAGFGALTISDHFHPWNDDQGQGSFVWSVIGAISQRTDLEITTAVTCPTVRIHPAIIAQAAATAACLTHGKFRLGLGSGEALNEVILGVNIALELQPFALCPVFDQNRNGTIAINELILGVNNGLNSCP